MLPLGCRSIYYQNATNNIIDLVFELINDHNLKKSKISQFGIFRTMVHNSHVMSNDNIIDRIGLNITILREQKGLTQEKLAELAGLHRAYIGQIERGEKNIGLRNLEKIAKGLNVPIKTLLENQY
jgi:DNA-binding XRE family transcriptional regulator